MQGTVINQIDLAEHEGLVRNLAKRIFQKWRGVIEIEDIEQLGRLGLMHAAERFEPERGLQFSTYATQCIFGFIQRGLRKIPLTPVEVQNKARKQGTDFPVLRSHVDTEGVNLTERAGTVYEDPADTLDSKEAAEALHAALASLSERHAHVLRRRFGIEGDKATLEQVAVELGLSRERIRQIETKALTHLRTALLKPAKPEPAQASPERPAASFHANPTPTPRTAKGPSERILVRYGRVEVSCPNAEEAAAVALGLSRLAARDHQERLAGNRPVSSRDLMRLKMSLAAKKRWQGASEEQRRAINQAARAKRWPRAG